MRVMLVHEHTTAPGQGGGGAESMLRDLTAALKGLGHEVAWLQSAQIERAVMQYKPDVVQVQTIHNAFGLAPAVWLQEHDVPHVWALMDYWPFCTSRNLLVNGDEACSAVNGVCDNACGHRAEWPGTVVNRSPVVALCEPSAAILRRNGVRVDYVAELGVDTELFQPGEKRDEPAVWAATPWGMHPVKGMRYLAEAVAGTHITANLITGQPRERVAELLRTAAVFAFPSCYEESFGLSLCEAMASGCAVVASDVAGARAQVHEGMGVLVPPRDPAALREAIQGLLAHPAQREAMGRAARAHTAAEHSLGAMGRRWEQVYEAVIDGQQ